MAFPVLLRKLFDNLGLGPKLRKEIIPTDIKVDNATSADSATKLATAQNIKLTGDVTGSASFDGTKESSISATLANSGATAGSYGPSANATPAAGSTFDVPYITVDAKGRVTAASTKTVKIPAAQTVDTSTFALKSQLASVTAGTTGPGANVKFDFTPNGVGALIGVPSNTITVPYFTVNAAGCVTARGTRTISFGKGSCNDCSDCSDCD